MKQPQPSDREVNRVRRALRTAAPPDLYAAGRADKVVRRGRRARIRRGTVGAVAVGLAATALVIGPHFIDSSPVTNSAAESPGATSLPPESASGSEISPYANPCPAAPVPVPDRPAKPVLLQPDVVMVRLCRAQGAGVSSPWQPPQDALVHQVDGFTGWLAQLPKAPADPCPAARVAPEPFALQFTDSAGRTTTFSSTLTTCGTVTVNFRRVAADRLLGVYRQLLTHQRDVISPQPPSIVLRCRSESTQILSSWITRVTARTRFVAAITCPPGGRAARPVSRSAIDLLNREWATGAHDAGRGTLPNAGSCATPLFGYFRSYAMTGYGDVVPVRMVACGVYRIGHLEFSPSGQLAQALSTR